MQNPENLIVYVRALRLCSETIRLVETGRVPDDDAQQLLRSAKSVPDNIAEGCGLETDKNLRRHLRIALGSTLEWRTQLTRLDPDIQVDAKMHKSLRSELFGLRKQLSSLIQRLTDKIGDGDD